MNRNQPPRNNQPVTSRTATLNGLVTTLNSHSQLTNTTNVQKTSSKLLSSQKLGHARSPRSTILISSQKKMKTSAVQGGSSTSAIGGMHQSCLSCPTQQIFAGCRQLQPSAKFDSSSCLRENEQTSQVPSSSYSCQATSTALPQSQQIAAVTTRRKSKLLNYATGSSSRKFSTQKRVVRAPQVSGGKDSMKSQLSDQHTMKSPEHLRFQVLSPEEKSLRRKGAELKNSGRPKFELDAPQMPLDFCQFNQGQDFLAEDVDGKCKLAVILGSSLLRTNPAIEQLKVDKESQEELFSMGSLKDLLVLSGGSRLQSNLTSSNLTMGEPANKNQNENPLNTSETDFIEAIKSRNNRFVRQRSEPGSFSFAGGRFNNSKDCLSQLGENYQVRQETQSSHNVGLDSADRGAELLRVPSNAFHIKWHQNFEKVHKSRMNDSPKKLPLRVPIKNKGSSILYESPFESSKYFFGSKSAIRHRRPSPNQRPRVNEHPHEETASMTSCSESPNILAKELSSPRIKLHSSVQQTSGHATVQVQTPGAKLAAEFSHQTFHPLIQNSSTVTPRMSTSNDRSRAEKFRQIRVYDKAKETYTTLNEPHTLKVDTQVLQEEQWPGVRISSAVTPRDLTLEMLQLEKNHTEQVVKQVVAPLLDNFDSRVRFSKKLSLSEQAPDVLWRQASRQSESKIFSPLQTTSFAFDGIQPEHTQLNQEEVQQSTSSKSNEKQSSNRRVKFLKEPVGSTVQAREKEEVVRSLLSRSVEPQQNRAGLHVSPMNCQLSRKHSNQAQAVYNDHQSTGYSSVKNFNLNQAANFMGIPHATKVINGVTSASEPYSLSQRECRSIHNQSVGPNDDSTSQLSSCRQRRAQYHRLLTAGKVQEVERQISIEIQSNNQDAISLYTRAKLAEKQKNYEQAIEDFGKALVLDPNFFNAAYGKAGCENIIGRYDDAIETYNIAFAKDNDIPVISQVSQSRLTSKRGSPCNGRLTSKSSKLFGTNSHQSPFRLHSIEPCRPIDNFISVQDELKRQQLSQRTCKLPFSFNNCAQPGLSSNISEVDSEHSEKSPVVNGEAAKLVSSFIEVQDAREVDKRKSKVQKDSAMKQIAEATPSFENFNLTTLVSKRELFSPSQPANREAVAKEQGLREKGPAVLYTGTGSSHDSERGPPTMHKKQPVTESRIQMVKKSVVMQGKGPLKVIKKGQKRKLKSPMLWPPTAMPSMKRNSANTKLQKLLKISSTDNISGSPSKGLQFDQDQLLKLTRTIRQPSSQRGRQSDQKPQNVTLIGQVNIQMPPPKPSQEKLSPQKGAPSNCPPPRKEPPSRENLPSQKFDKKDQKELVVTRRHTNNSQQTETTHKVQMCQKDATEQEVTHRNSDNKGQFSEDSFKMSSKPHLSDGVNNHKMISPICATQESRTAESTEKYDLSKTYHYLSSQLFKSQQTSKQTLAMSRPRLPKDPGCKRDLKEISENESTTTIEQQPEWYMLAQSSYKMKRYGECLFAVSKAANAIQRIEKNYAAKRRRSSWSSLDMFGAAVSKYGEKTIEFTSQGSLHEDFEMFDADGNLTTLGLAHLFYLKAKCLCKLDRFSESLFQIAKIHQLSQSSVTLLPERQQKKAQLYKAICLTKTKQFKSAVFILNDMLASLEVQQQELFANARQSLAGPNAALSSLLISAYNCRGHANEELQDYEQALSDYDKLLELCQFQDLPTKKVFQYMTVRSVILSKLESSKNAGAVPKKP